MCTFVLVNKRAKFDIKETPYYIYDRYLRFSRKKSRLLYAGM